MIVSSLHNLIRKYKITCLIHHAVLYNTGEQYTMKKNRKNYSLTEKTQGPVSFTLMRRVSPVLWVWDSVGGIPRVFMYSCRYGIGMWNEIQSPRQLRDVHWTQTVKKSHGLKGF